MENNKEKVQKNKLLTGKTKEELEKNTLCKKTKK